MPRSNRISMRRTGALRVCERINRSDSAPLRRPWMTEVTGGCANQELDLVESLGRQTGSWKTVAVSIDEQAVSLFEISSGRLPSRSRSPAVVGEQ